MGLKYIEPVKSVVLILLVFMSITLSFSIWTYTPKYPTIEEATTVDVSIADKRDVEDVLKPYKIIFNFKEGLKGTTDLREKSSIVEALKSWEITNIGLADSKFSGTKVNKFFHEINRFTLYFHGEVPLPVYDMVLNKEASNYPETTFDRLTVEWSPGDPLLKVHFTSSMKGMRYTGEVKINDFQDFNRSVLTEAKDYLDYKEINSGNSSFIAVPTEPIEIVRNIYYQDGVLPSRFRDALFSDPHAVRRGQITTTREEYQDNHAIMSIDSKRKVLNFVHPIVESKDSAIPSVLLKKTIDFVNEHGGWTDEYRFTYMDPKSRKVKFQLFVHDLPVHSEMTSTEIEQTWGIDQVFRYVRPYYMLDLTFDFEPLKVLLPSGVDVAKALIESKTVDFSTVEAIELGYFLKHDTEHDAEERLFVLEPSWFYLIKGKWNRYSPEELGGEKIGLE
ncbi:YycH family regulatory protein [Sporosarcina sp. G11-34]|uniref:YycH family regulatory protein n=1 Tax=Sporosarcina sp. G11-34 TaxID=2849605 RepID=UPI0022A8F976|nr:two-component system activity regulator YycH [Sporosarcina sp. G11-34]MCZ2259057.1 hypothetical protein [Sporosarcina sp. G11-34]